MCSISEITSKLHQFKNNSDDFDLDPEALEKFENLAAQFLSEGDHTFTENDAIVLKLRAVLLEASGAEVVKLSSVIDKKMQEVISRDKHPKYFENAFWELCRTFDTTIHDHHDDNQPLLVQDMEKLIDRIEEEQLKNMLDSNFDFKIFHDCHFQILQKLSKEDLSKLCKRFSLSRLGVIAALGKEDELKTRDEIDSLFAIYDLLGQNDHQRLFSEMGSRLNELLPLFAQSSEEVRKSLKEDCSKRVLQDVDQLIEIWNHLK